MIEAKRIAEVMGGKSVLGRVVSSIEELEEIVGEGLPKIALRITVRRVFVAAREANRYLYRVVPEGTKPKVVKLPAETAKIVPLLAHANGWVRDTAQRVLVERGGAAVAQAVKEIVSTSSRAGCRARSIALRTSRTRLVTPVEVSLCTTQTALML